MEVKLGAKGKQNVGNLVMHKNCDNIPLLRLPSLTRSGWHPFHVAVCPAATPHVKACVPAPRPRLAVPASAATGPAIVPPLGELARAAPRALCARQNTDARPRVALPLLPPPLPPPLRALGGCAEV